MLSTALRLGVLMCGCLVMGCHDRTAAAAKDKAADAPPSELQAIDRILATPPKDDYERTVMRMFGIAIGPDALQQVCSRKFPQHQQAVADAYVEWRKQNAAVLEELTTRSTAIWEANAGADREYVGLVYPHLQKQAFEATLRKFDQAAADAYEPACAILPQTLRSDELNLEKKYGAELAIIRARAL